MFFPWSKFHESEHQLNLDLKKLLLFATMFRDLYNRLTNTLRLVLLVVYVITGLCCVIG
jgi:hypothetical protein